MVREGGETDESEGSPLELGGGKVYNITYSYETEVGIPVRSL